MKLKIFFILSLAVILMVGCASKDVEVVDVTEEIIDIKEEAVVEEEKVNMTIGTLRGPTGMGMAQLMENASTEASQLAYTFDVLGSPDDLVGKIISGEVDVAAVPTNMALLLYNRTEGAIQLAAVNTLGVLYLLENGDEIQSIEDLRGKTVNTSGKGASPDYIFQYLLNENGLKVDEDLNLDYNLEHADLAAAMVEGDVKIGLLPQPHVTTAMVRNPDLRIALDLTHEWEQTTPDNTTLPMGVIIVQKSFIASHPEAFELFLTEYAASVAFVNNNLDEGAELIEKYGILPSAAIAKAAIPNSNIVFMDAQDAKVNLEKFYEILFEFEPRSIGGKLADEGFYYQR